MRTENKEKDIWEKHGLERDFGSKMFSSIVYVLMLPILLLVFVIPATLALFFVTIFMDWLFPNIVFPYNLFFQIPVIVYVVWKVWCLSEEK